MTVDEMRALVLSFPGAEEGMSYGIETMVCVVKKYLNG